MDFGFSRALGRQAPAGSGHRPTAAQFVLPVREKGGREGASKVDGVEARFFHYGGLGRWRIDSESSFEPLGEREGLVWSEIDYEI